MVKRPAEGKGSTHRWSDERLAEALTLYRSVRNQRAVGRHYDVVGERMRHLLRRAIYRELRAQGVPYEERYDLVSIQMGAIRRGEELNPEQVQIARQILREQGQIVQSLEAMVWRVTGNMRGFVANSEKASAP